MVLSIFNIPLFFNCQALCAEAALLALRRRYPQVYQSKDKLLLDLSQINVERRDFDQAVQRLVPASQRSTSGSGKPLSTVVTPLLENLLQQLIKTTQSIFPEGVATLKLKGKNNCLSIRGDPISNNFVCRSFKRNKKAN